MLESSFMYIAAAVSVFAIFDVVGTIFLVMHLRDNFNDATKLHLPAVIFSILYEVGTIVLACIIMQDVIINIYCYLFLTKAFIVLCASLIYFDYYRRARKRYKASKAEEKTTENVVEDKKEEEKQEAQPIKLNNTAKEAE